MKLVVVTASTDLERSAACFQSWGPGRIICVANGPKTGIHDSLIIPASLAETDLVAVRFQNYLGSVPAFKHGVDFALEFTDADIIACLHDDVEMQQADWRDRVIRHFEKVPACGLLGFGGAVGLGDDDIYQKPYEPVQLARKGFRSNLADAEVHGIRSLLPEQVACLDGFSQIGRRDFWMGMGYRPIVIDKKHMPGKTSRPWDVLEDLGVIHHFYDGALGCLAARYGWETWYLPIRCRHYGGQTAVGDRGYQEWAKTQTEFGDQGFWEQAHRVCYNAFRDVLPLRV